MTTTQLFNEINGILGLGPSEESFLIDILKSLDGEIIEDDLEEYEEGMYD